MNRYVGKNSFGLNSQNATQSIITHNNIIDKSSNLSLSYYNLDKISIFPSNIGLYHFTESAEKLLKNNPNRNSYALLAFDIDNISEISKLYGIFFVSELFVQISSTLRNHIMDPNLYCNMNENFAILLENYTSIDIAMLVIQLSEEISNINPELNIKLAFGICIAGPADQNISFLYKRAFLAKSTIKGKDQPLLANYTETRYRKHRIRSSQI
jgi:GGDEF domain-containing protein